jgi:hypothetical protein
MEVFKKKFKHLKRKMKMTWSIATALVWILIFETLGLASGQLYTHLDRDGMAQAQGIRLKRISDYPITVPVPKQEDDYRELTCMAYIPR